MVAIHTITSKFNKEMKDLFQTLGKALAPDYRTMPLAAIWLERSLQTENEKTHRITEGHKVHVDKYGKLQDCSEEKQATHCITGCHGTVHNTDLHFTAIHLKTQELIRINL